MILKTSIRVCLWVSVCTVCMWMWAGFFISKAAVCSTDWQWDWYTTFPVKKKGLNYNQTKHKSRFTFQIALHLRCERIHIQDKLTPFLYCYVLFAPYLSLSDPNRCKCTVEICTPKIGGMFFSHEIHFSLPGQSFSYIQLWKHMFA